MKNRTIEIGVNAPHDLQSFNTNKTNDDIANLKKLRGVNICRTDLEDKNRFDVLVIDSRISKPSESASKEVGENDETILNITEKESNLVLNTGKFIGVLTINGVNVRINSGYTSFFTNRLLDSSNDIFFNKESKFDNGIDEAFEKLLPYLFLSSLQRASIIGLPKEYTLKREQNYNLRGSVLLSEYLKDIKNVHKGIKYVYRARHYNRDILDTLSAALYCCDKQYISSNFKESSSLILEIIQNSGKRKVAPSVINKARKSPILNNEMYAGFKKVLAYAELLIGHKGMTPLATNKNKIATGWLIDIADLWELYLYKMLKRKFGDWTISYQEKIPIYKDLFFKREFVPDIVMKNGNSVVILDAKFKKMDFNMNGNDVDREDLQQIHTYYCYYKEKGFDVKFFSLIYPARNNPPEDKRCFGNAFDSDGTSKFGISYLLVGQSPAEQRINEREFINRLSKQII